MKAVVRSTVVFFVSLMVAQSGFSFIIDSFDVQQGDENSVYVSAVAVASSEGQFTPAWGQVVDRNGGILGERDIYVVKSFGTGSEVVSGRVLPGNSYLGYSEQMGARGEIWVTWDGKVEGVGKGAKDEVDTDGLNSADFTVRGQDELAMTLYVPAAGNHSLSLHVWDFNSDFTVTKTVGSSAQNQTIVFDYAEFTGIDWADIGAVQLGWVTDVTTEGGATARFRYLETQDNGNPENVPEPGTIALMSALLGLGGFGAIRRRLSGSRQVAVA